METILNFNLFIYQILETVTMGVVYRMRTIVNQWQAENCQRFVF